MAKTSSLMEKFMPHALRGEASLWGSAGARALRGLRCTFAPLYSFVSRFLFFSFCFFFPDFAFVLLLVLAPLASLLNGKDTLLGVFEKRKRKNSGGGRAPPPVMPQKKKHIRQFGSLG